VKLKIWAGSVHSPLTGTRCYFIQAYNIRLKFVRTFGTRLHKLRYKNIPEGEGCDLFVETKTGFRSGSVNLRDNFAEVRPNSYMFPSRTFGQTSSFAELRPISSIQHDVERLPQCRRYANTIGITISVFFLSTTN